MQLSKENLRKINLPQEVLLPDEKILSLPEKVLQFGTGVLLRGLPDFFIDKANRQGIFNGRVVVVKSTDKGDTNSFEKQDGLYTICTRGIAENRNVEEMMINASISRVLSAGQEWKEILQCAHNPEIQLIISNTTEVGIAPSDDDIRQSPPPSFPGKLLAFLYERYQASGGNADSGLVIIPTELIISNGDKLRSIVLELAEKNKLDKDFMAWLKSANHFCNSLVDRIVPGQPSGTDKTTLEETLGYKDELMIVTEYFRLWAIESANKKVNAVLSFSKADDGVIIAPDIEKFRELKLRLLNGPHTFCAAIALLAGFNTVKESMNHKQFLELIRHLMLHEIATAMESDAISYEEASAFANKVIDRFRNPFLEHKWLSIAVNYTSKMRMRNIPLLEQHYAKTGRIPPLMAFGFAAYIVFMKGSEGADKRYYHEINGQTCLIEDEAAAWFAEKWATDDIDRLVDAVLNNKDFWGTDLGTLKGLAPVIKKNIRLIEQEGMLAAINSGQLHQIAGS
jgi:tagaturonate reductase